MAFLDKLTSITKNIGKKAGEVVETTKLSVKISGEKDSILENQRKIGEHYYNKLQGTEVDEEAKAFFDAIEASFANIAAYEKEIEEQKAESVNIFKVEETVVVDAKPAEPVTEDAPAEPAPPAEEAPQAEAEPTPPEAEQQPEEQAPPSEGE